MTATYAIGERWVAVLEGAEVKPLVQAPAPEHFTSRLRSPAVAARVGMWLGICFGICFLTGLISHYAQEPSHPIPFPTSPSWGYRVTQGLHVTTGVASIPLLLVKLWSVYPRLFERPPFGNVRRLAVNALERASIGVLVASAIFQLVTGLLNAAQWYPWSFSFRTTHYALAWIAIGSLILHIAVKLPIIRDALLRRRRGHHARPPHRDGGRADVSARAAPHDLDGQRRRRARHRRRHRAAAAQHLGVRRALRRRSAGHPDQQVGSRGQGHRRWRPAPAGD